MDCKTSSYLAALCLGLGVWLYLSVVSVHVDYKWHNFLVNSTTGDKSRPMDVIDLNKIIKPLNGDNLNKTNAIDRLFVLMQQMNYQNTPGIAQIYSDHRQLEQSGWPVANQSACDRQLGWIQQQLDAHKQYGELEGQLGYELTRLMDTFGKPSSGLYSGVASTWPGQYGACKQVRLDGGRIGMGRYCIAEMRLKWWPAREPGIPKTRLKVGICIPETCDTLSFERQRNRLDSLIKFDLNEFLRENLVLESMYCLPDERSPVRKLPTGGWIYLGLIMSWLVMVAITSIVYGAVKSKVSKKFNQVPEHLEMLSNGRTSESTSGQTRPPAPAWLGLVKIMSIQQSWASFASNSVASSRRAVEMNNKTGEPNPRVDLSSINIIKCLSVVAFISAHSCILTFVYATSMDHNIKLHLSNVWFVGASFGNFVDVFFVLFGLLAAYNNLRKYGRAELGQARTWFFINCYTLIRIGVLYVVLYWFFKTVEPYTGEGPWWDYGTYRYSMRGNCLQEPWWRSIPYFSALGPRPRTSCLLAGWFAVALAQISLAVPLIIYLLHALPPKHLYRYGLLAFITLMSGLQMVIKMLGQTTVRGEAFGAYGGFLVTLLEQFEDNGMLSSLGRLNSVAYGCYVGYLLHLYEIRAISEWPRWLRSKWTLTGTLIGILIVLLTPLAGKIAMGYTNYVTGVGNFLVTYLATLVAWPALTGLLVLNMATTFKRTPLVRALGHPFWYTANKLVFGLYLIHWQVLMYLVTGYPEDGPPAATWLGVFKLTSLGFVLSLALTFPLVILVDTPLRTLLSLLVSKIQTRCDTKRTFESNKYDSKVQG